MKAQFNPTGFEIDLDALIDSQEFAPDPEQTKAILVTIDRVPLVLYWMEKGAWETMDGEIVKAFDRWIYLR